MNRSAGQQDRFDRLSQRANTRSDPDAMAALWDAVFALEEWVVVGRVSSGPEGDGFAPMTADIDGQIFAAAFTDTARAERFLEEQGETAEVVSLPLLDAIELLADLAIAGAATGVIFNDGTAPFLAPIADLPDLLTLHTPGYH
ncbi:MAG: hypothetical protein ACTS22_00820 [Phycisphaerales bacterium]